MTKIIMTDPHITESAIPELENIFKEIFKQNADMLICVGDYYDKKRPTAKEVIFGTKWAYFFKKRFKKVIFLRGNHDRTRDISAIDYLLYLGIEVVDEYIDKDNIYYGHYMVNESKYGYGTAKCGIKELSKYRFVILGHMHSYQILSKNAIHLGSVRYCNFNESKDERKYIMIFFNGINGQRMSLDSPIPMKDVTSIKELLKINKNTKVRLIIKSYQQFKEEVNEIAKYKDKFVEFKLKLQLEDVIPNKEDKLKDMKERKLIDVLRQGIEKIEDEDVKTLLKEIIK